LFNSHNSRTKDERYPAQMGIEPGPDMYAGAAEGEYVLSLVELLRVVWRRLWVVLSVAVVLAGTAVGWSFGQTPIYQASIKILVGQEPGTTEVPIGVNDLQLLTQTMAEGVDSRPVAEATIKQLGLRTTPENLIANLNVEQVSQTQFIQVSFADPNPKRAQQVINALGNVFSDQISEVSPSANAVTATVWERAVVPDYPVSPNPLRNGFLALVLGLMIGVALAFLLEQLDDSWRSPEEAEQISGVPTFGVIPEVDVSKSKKRGVY
jgi:capsular polysaccharide biosynthesis protein